MINAGKHQDRRLRAFWRRLRRDQAGTSAVEFALVAPILVAMLGGIVEIGHLFMVQAELTATTREAVRRIATDVMDEEETAAFVHDRFAGIPQDAMTIAITSVELDSGRTDVTVNLSVPVEEVALFNMTHLFPDDLSLDVSGTMVKE